MRDSKQVRSVTSSSVAARLRCIGMPGIVVLLACGGRVNGQTNDAGNSSSSGGTGSSSSGAPGGDGSGGSSGGALDASLPAVGTAACDRPDRTCIRCDDGQWHCGNAVFIPCPPNLDAGASCTGALSGSNYCFSCKANGMGDQWHCVAANPNYGSWTLTPQPCSE
jgi:hypothetical protein